MTDGIVLIVKPAHMTSFGVVARVRRVLSQRAGKKVKVGHTGTLDPFATGLMILVVGTECRSADVYTKLDKTYHATIHLGQTSTTGDPEGELTTVSATVPSRQEIDAVCVRFVGEITQIPPQFSAIKINGRRAYDLARRGEIVTMPSRQVTIHRLEVIEYCYPSLIIRAHVSSGTYIRTLAADIGEALGTGAYCSALRRETIGKWCVDQASALDSFGVAD